MAQQQEYGLQTTEANRKHTVLWAFMAAIPLLALLGMEMATLKIASDYGFHPMLGAALVFGVRCSSLCPVACFYMGRHLPTRHG